MRTQAHASSARRACPGPRLAPRSACRPICAPCTGRCIHGAIAVVMPARAPTRRRLGSISCKETLICRPLFHQPREYTTRAFALCDRWPDCRAPGIILRKRFRPRSPCARRRGQVATLRRSPACLWLAGGRLAIRCRTRKPRRPVDRRTPAARPHHSARGILALALALLDVVPSHGLLSSLVNPFQFFVFAQLGDLRRAPRRHSALRRFFRRLGLPGSSARLSLPAGSSTAAARRSARNAVTLDRKSASRRWSRPDARVVDSSDSGGDSGPGGSQHRGSETRKARDSRPCRTGGSRGCHTVDRLV